MTHQPGTSVSDVRSSDQYRLAARPPRDAGRAPPSRGHAVSPGCGATGRETKTLAAELHDGQPRSAAGNSVESLGLGELTYLPRGARLGRGDIYILRDMVASLSITTGCHVALARHGDMIGLHRLLLPAHPEIVATVVRQGHAVRIRQDCLREAMRATDALHLRLLGYAFRTNAAYLSEAALNTTLTVEQRVARWLARYATSTQENGIEITHQELATLLSVRRAGVTNALHILEGEDLLRSRRSRVEILKRDRLAVFARLANEEPDRAREAARG